MTLAEIATSLKEDDARIILAYAFNATGNTQLCVAYKDATKLIDDSHVGVYYNAYSEDLFVWNNDEENDGADVRLTVQPSSLSKFHASLNEVDVREKLKAYKPKYEFAFRLHEDAEKGIESIFFYIPDADLNIKPTPIKISRGEERIFVWCFFLAMFEVEGWADKQSSHFFIDDPVSSLDDYNIFITASTLFSLIENHHKKRKIIITTHHIGIFSILSDWLTKGEKSGAFKKQSKLYILSNKSGELALESCRDDVMLYHLRLCRCWIRRTEQMTYARTISPCSVRSWRILRRFLALASSDMCSARSASTMLARRQTLLTHCLTRRCITTSLILSFQITSGPSRTSSPSFKKNTISCCMQSNS